MDLIESRILPWPTYGCTRLLNDAFELKTYEHYCDHHKRTLPTSCRLFSYFGAAATSFLVKTFYYATEHVIDDFARLTKYPVDQHTAESDKTVHETTYYWCCVQEWGRYWCMWRAEKVQIILGFQSSKNWEDDLPNFRLHGTNGKDHSYNRADLLLLLEDPRICYIVWRQLHCKGFEVWVVHQFWTCTTLWTLLELPKNNRYLISLKSLDPGSWTVCRSPKQMQMWLPTSLLPRRFVSYENSAAFKIQHKLWSWRTSVTKLGWSTCLDNIPAGVKESWTHWRSTLQDPYFHEIVVCE